MVVRCFVSRLRGRGTKHDDRRQRLPTNSLRIQTSFTCHGAIPGYLFRNDPHRSTACRLASRRRRPARESCSSRNPRSHSYGRTGHLVPAPQPHRGPQPGNNTRRRLTIGNLTNATQLSAPPLSSTVSKRLIDGKFSGGISDSNPQLRRLTFRWSHENRSVGAGDPYFSNLGS